MKTVVITGPVCGGKSTLAGRLAALGAALVDADRLGHAVLERPEVRAGLAARFGPGILGEDGIDRRRLGDMVFGDPRALAVLDRTVHPPLAGLIDAKLRELESAGIHVLAVLEAAVYFLLPIRYEVDLVVLVTAGRDIRLQRLRDRTGMSEAAAAVRIAAQEPLCDDWRRADMVVINEGRPQELDTAAGDILERLGLAEPPAAPRQRT